MSIDDRAYLGGGDWIEFRNAAVPLRGEYVDIPLRDVTPLVIEVLRRDLLDPGQALLILEAAERSLLRKADRDGNSQC
jgi:hypothetical protein